jgi:hypothetical protein
MSKSEEPDVSDWKRINTFDPDTQCGRGYLGWFPECKCTFDMTWVPFDDERAMRGKGMARGHFVPFGGHGRLQEQPSHWREMPEPPTN